MAYQKTLDLLDLAIWMQSTREGVSLNDICSSFEVSRRTSERMRDLIVEKFPQTQEVIEENNQKRWYIPQGTLKDFIQFSAEELAVLENAKDLFIKHSLDDKLKTLETITNKIKASIKKEVYRKIEPDTEALLEAEGFLCRPGPKIKVDEHILNTVRQAILECHLVQIIYYNKNTKKLTKNTLEPYGFLYGDRNHYLVARHSDNYYGDELHHFILTNIKEVKILDVSYSIKKGFSLQEYSKRSFGSFFEEPFEVEWLFDASVAEEVKKYIFHPSQEMIENSDGSITIKLFTGGRLEMDWHLYTWGDKVKVIKPTS
ncbi:MAG: WYL domain-containing protein [Alphaproteobacteria bacterium]